jgi:hypothetical protein
MPLLNGQPYQPSLALPEGIRESDEVFHIKLTGELVSDYEEYVRKSRLYRQRQWTCSETGAPRATAGCPARAACS